MQSKTPTSFPKSVWPLSLSLATTYEISVDFSSSPYLDVSVQEVPLIYLCIQYMIYELLSYGLLHSDICGSMFAYNSPQLFAVNHVLLRLPMPRHSPCALISFTICFRKLWVFFAFLLMIFEIFISPHFAFLLCFLFSFQAAFLLYSSHRRIHFNKCLTTFIQIYPS